MGRSWVLAGVIAAAAVGCDGGDDTSVTGCTESDLDACEYASPGLEFTQRDAQVPDGSTTGRSLPLRIRVPEGDGPFRVVVYSHGGGFNDGGHAFGLEWAEALASHGYVTVNIGHTTLNTEQAVAFCAIGSVPTGECTVELLGNEDSGLVALVKSQDVVGVIDALPTLAAIGADLGGPVVETDEVAVIGWSGGSRATMASSGASFYPSPSAPAFSETDGRIVTRVAFSPTGPGFGGFFDDGGSDSWDTFDGPSLMATGGNDVKPSNPALTGPIRREAYELSPADGSRRLLYSTLPEGQGGHGTYNLADLESSDEAVARFSRALRSAVRAFLDDTLSDDGSAHDWLETDDAHVLAGDADWESK